LIMSYETGFEEIIKSSATRVTLFLVVSLSPCFTVFSAILNSNSVINNCTASYILPSDLKKPDAQSKEKLIYLGKLSEHLFFFKKESNEVVTYNLPDLKYYPKK